jgi:hypothetical protein
MKKNNQTELTTTKVTKKTLQNAKIASALSEKKQYEIIEEGTEFMKEKYSKKQSKSKSK